MTSAAIARQCWSTEATVASMLATRPRFRLAIFVFCMRALVFSCVSSEGTNFDEDISTGSRSTGGDPLQTRRARLAVFVCRPTASTLLG